MAEPDDERLLTLDEAFRATFHFIEQYYQREPIEPFLNLLTSMTPWDSGDGFDRKTSDPATWQDWMTSVAAARNSTLLPEGWQPRQG